jgi:hypothetical protein
MTYLVDTWYVELPDGRLEPVANLATAQYLMSVGAAVRIVDVNRMLHG